MSLRINPDLFNVLVAALAANRPQEYDGVQEAASGQELNSPAQAPADVAASVQVRIRADAADEYLHNISALRFSMHVADSTLNSALLALTSAISLGIQGANGTLSRENRQAIAQQVQDLQQQLLSLANTSFEGNFLFAGTNVRSEPFELDPSSPSGVRYVGNVHVNSVEVAEDEAIPSNLLGSQIFSQPGSDVFQAMHDLVVALQTGSGIEAATAEVQKAFNYLNTQRSFYGSTLARLDTAERFLNREKSPN
jgi:flagellar hook-associated protein 3 FlgL